MAEFEPLTTVGATGSSEFGFLGFGGDFVAGGWGSLGFRGAGTSTAGGRASFGFAGFGGDFSAGGWGEFGSRGVGAAGIPAIEIAGGGGEFGFRAAAKSASHRYSDAVVQIGFRGFGGNFTAGGWGTFGFIGIGAQEIIPEQNPLWLFSEPGFLYMTTGYQIAAISDSLTLAQTEVSQPIYLLSSGFGMAADEQSVLQTLSKVTDHLTLVDALGALYRLLVQEGFSLTHASAESALLTVELIDALMLAGEPGTAIEATSKVAEALALQDALGILAKEQIADQVAFSAAFNAALIARERMINALLLEQTDNHSVVMTAIAEESLLIGATPASILEAFNSITDSISFALTIRIGDTVYAAWVCNTETKAFSNYENYPFNSFFSMRGKHYGVATNGIYLLEGDDDDGAKIPARIRTGLWNLGTGKMKRVPSLYLGFRASGNMVLKVITTSDDGEKTENWYELKPPTANVMRESRIKIGRGLKSVYWGYELANVDGADFALNDLQLFPMILDRRISGGSHGA